MATAGKPIECWAAVAWEVRNPQKVSTLMSVRLAFYVLITAVAFQLGISHYAGQEAPGCVQGDGGPSRCV